MGSMLKFDSDRRELVRERRDARIERKQQRRQARERKHSHVEAAMPSVPSATQRIAQQELRAAVDRIVGEALERHEQAAPVVTSPAVASASAVAEPATEAGANGNTGGRSRRRASAAPVATRARPRRVPRAPQSDGRRGAQRGAPADRASRRAGVGR